MNDWKDGFTGALLDPSSQGYDDARRVFNGLFDRRPRWIARCAGVDDVVRAVGYARSSGLKTVIRGGGHSVAGFSTVDDGLVIDLSEMRQVDVDPDARVVRIQAGATWRDVDLETQRFGLATPGGVVSHTGVAGLILNGGIGWLRNRWGLSVDNLVAAEVVTASGARVKASADSHPDLLWALKGGGGNFGVVTSFEMALHPVGPDVAAAFAMYDLERADDILRRWRDWAEAAPDDVTSEVVLWTMPDWPAIPEAVRGRPVVIPSAMYAGDAALGQPVLDPIRHYGQRRHEIVGPMPYVDVQSAFDAFIPNDGSVLAYWKSHVLDELSDAAVACIAQLGNTRSGAYPMIVLQHLGTGVRSVPKASTAYYRRDGRYVVNLMGMWTSHAESETHTQWIKTAWQRLQPFSTRAPYLNYEGLERPEEAHQAIAAAFGANFARLLAIKQKYDPSNLFRSNQNIVASAAA